MKKPYILFISLLVTGVLAGVLWYAASPREAKAAPGPASVAPAVNKSGPGNKPSAVQNSSVQKAAKVDSIDTLVGGLQRRLELEPDDVSGWVLLAKSYHFLGRWEEAQAAFEKARSLGYTGTSPSSAETLQQSNPKSSRQPALFPPIGNQQLFSGISAVVPHGESKTSDAGAAPGLKLSVSLSAALLARLASDASVFIFARSADIRSDGSPNPPLAVVRKSVGDLPIELTLDDSMAMISGRGISSAQNVVVGARVALSGSPVKKPGDPEALSDPVPPTYTRVIELAISEMPGAESP